MVPFIVIENDQDVLAALKKHAPIFIKPFLPEKIDPTVGKSLGYVNTRPGMLAIGVEITRDGDFFERIPEKINSQIKTQSRGILFLLNTLLENATADSKTLQPVQNRAAGFPG